MKKENNTPTIESESPTVEQPYIYLEVVVIERKYNPKFGDEKICECGHPYYRHFDTYEQMEAVGCKYCECFEFKEAKRALLHYACATCGNTCLDCERPDNSICGGCEKPDWKLLKHQTAYIVGTSDYLHPEGEI